MNTTEWNKEDHELYAKWQRLVTTNEWDAFGVDEWLRMVEEEGIAPTEVGEVQNNRYQDAQAG